MQTKKWALITGASSGIGLATAEKLAGEGFNLVIVSRTAEKLGQIKQKLESLYINIKVKSLPLDLLDTVAIQKVLPNFLRDLPEGQGIDVLVNNAGLALGVSKFQDGDLLEWETMFNTNVRSLLYLTRLLLPQMIARKSGHIVNLGSVAGRWVYPGGSIYCATKHAVRVISEGLRMDLLGTGVRVTDIEPGMVETNFSVVRFKDEAKAKAVYQGMAPLSGTDIAEAISWCIRRPNHVNIQEMVIYPTDQAGVRDVHRRG